LDRTHHRRHFGALGATASGIKVSSGGRELLSGIDSGTTLSGGTQYVFGTAVGATASNGGFQVVESGATASGQLTMTNGARPRRLR